MNRDLHFFSNFAYTDEMKRDDGVIKWIIRDIQGKIIGPYSREAIFNLIDRGIIVGDEMLAIFPDGNWEAFAREVEFYDRLMDSLEGKRGELKPSSHRLMEENTVVMQLSEKDILEVKDKKASFDHKPINPNEKLINPQSEDGQVKAIVNNFHPDRKYKVKINNPLPGDEKAGKTKNKITRKKNDPTRTKSPKVILVSSVIFLALIYLIIFDGHNTGSGAKIHLLAPTERGRSISNEEYSRSVAHVRTLIESDNFSDWNESQNILVKLAEGLPTNTEIREMICFVHKELWPYTFQDAEDLQVLNYMTQSTRAISPDSTHGRSCQMIQSLLTGKLSEAKNQLDRLLEESPDSMFYAWIKADVLLAEKDFINAQGFANSVINVWPNFFRAQIILAQSLEGLGQYQQAVDIYQSIIKKNPKHKVAKIRLGTIEFENYRAVDLAWTILTSALNTPDLVHPTLEARGYKDLAEMSLLKNQMASAQKYIDKAYSLDPIDPQVRELYQRLGGNKKIDIKDSKAAELIAQGDQLARTGDCFIAQAQYKAAFELDPQSGLAALKASRCLWKINQSLEAIDFLKKAILNDPSYFPAYTQLADYYSQKYDFASANRILSLAKQNGDETYELIRGQAQLEYRKNNFKLANALAQRASKIYDTDIETHMLLANSYLGLGQVREAFHAAARAIELDSVNSEAHIVYGQVLYSYQGVDSAIRYLDNLIKQNQNLIDYKLAIANIYKKEEKYPQSLELYRQVTIVDPKNKLGLIGMGESLQGIGQMENALSAYLNASTVDPTDPEALFKAGLLYYETARFGPAIQQFERVLMVNKFYPRVKYFIGRAAFAQGDIQKALEYATLEKKQNPNLADPYVLLGEIYSATRKYTLCTGEYQQAIRLQPQGASIYVKIARCYRLSGSYDVASSMIEIAIQKESGFPDIYKEKGAVFQALGEFATAFAAYEKYLALSPNAVDRFEIESLMSTIQSK
jgi:tetratricopeptide (TPR) repeat protein